MPVTLIGRVNRRRMLAGELTPAESAAIRDHASSWHAAMSPWPTDELQGSLDDFLNGVIST